MRQPEISLGAWRPLAVQLGGLEALVDALRAELIGRRRTGDPHQLARFGKVLMAEETTRLWLERAAVLAEGGMANPDDAANYVKLARVAIETACVRAIQLAERAAGLSAFVRPNVIERLSRDLSTYLRQPALDMVLDEAAAYFMTRPTP
jgi:alkylation response protein AidB-like acyl-CoA dehydrogenase